jgi:hypothetical protein
MQLNTGDFCNRRSIKCSKIEDPPGRCQNCVDFDVPCTFDRPSKRRGVKAESRVTGRDTRHPMTPGDPYIPTSAATSSSERASGPSHSSTSGDPWFTFDHGWSPVDGDEGDLMLHRSWRAFAIASDRQIKNLVQVFFETVYPMYVDPCCHWVIG